LSSLEGFGVPSSSRSRSAAVGWSRPLVIPPYMDAPSLQGFHFMTAWHRWRLQPYIRTFYEATASVPDGICWSGSNHFCALDAPWGEQDLPDPGLTYPAITS